MLYLFKTGVGAQESSLIYVRNADILYTLQYKKLFSSDGLTK